MIPKKTIGLLDRLGDMNNTSTSIGIPITASTPEKHNVPKYTNKLRGPWKIAPPPTNEQNDDLHLFRLSVKKDKKKSWKIEVTDLNTGKPGIHSSGFGAPFSMNGQVKTGTELLGDTHGS